MSKAVVIIPARWGSSRFPGKPLYRNRGKTATSACLGTLPSRAKNRHYVIATDDMRIADAAFAWGAEVALTSAKHHSGTDRIAEVAENGKKFAIIVNVQGDEPLVDPRLIDRFVETLRTNRDVGIVTAAHPFRRSARCPFTASSESGNRS